MTNSGEKWVSIKGYEQYYEISNFGKIRTKLRIVKFKDGRQRIQEPKIMRLRKGNYLTISLNKGGKQNQFTVHRLVAKHFVLNINNKPEVNHKNGIKYDNVSNNLEWVTCAENHQHANKTGLRKSPKGRKISKQGKLNMSKGQKERYKTETVWNKGIKQKHYEKT